MVLSSVPYFRACADVLLRIYSLTHSLNLWMMLTLVVQGRYRKTFQSGLFCRPCTKYPLHRLRLATTITTTSRRLVTKQKNTRHYLCFDLSIFTGCWLPSPEKLKFSHWQSVVHQIPCSALRSN